MVDGWESENDAVSFFTSPATFERGWRFSQNFQRCFSTGNFSLKLIACKINLQWKGNLCRVLVAALPQVSYLPPTVILKYLEKAEFLGTFETDENWRKFRDENCGIFPSWHVILLSSILIRPFIQSVNVIITCCRFVGACFLSCKEYDKICWFWKITKCISFSEFSKHAGGICIYSICDKFFSP